LHTRSSAVTGARLEIAEAQVADLKARMLKSERTIGLQRLIGQVELMAQQSGAPTGFDAAKWVAQWLEQPSAALGDKRPTDFMDTAQGQAIVSDLLAQMQSGAFA
jgi:uncharacterized protein (DUF2384 family)